MKPWTTLIGAAFLLCWGREACAQPIDSVLGIYSERFPQEKIYLHLDRSIYNKGETIWFKAYLLAGFDPSTHSRNIYFDWFDTNGKLLKHEAAPIFEASAKGQFDIPAGYEGRSLHVRAYTQWMLNFDTAFLYNKDIPVARASNHDNRSGPSRTDQARPDQPRTDQPRTDQPRSDQPPTGPPRTELGFFPEGGDLVDGLVSKVAFKANNQWGVPVAVSGIVQGSDGSVVDSLTTAHDGMGSFFIKPAAGVAYSAFWTDGSGKTFHTGLPTAAAGGAGLQVQPHADQTTIIVRRTADHLPEGLRSPYLLVHMNQHVIYTAQLRLDQKTEVAVQVPTVTLPTGVLQITLFDAAWKPVAERVIFVNNRLHLFTASVNLLATSLGKRGKNEVEISVPDSVFSNMSVSVTDGDLPAGNDDIVSGLLLSDDIKGAVYHPSWYFSGDPAAARQLDLVMLTHGWRRCKWQDIVQGRLPEMRFPRDSNYLELRGRVTPDRVKDLMAGQQVMLILQTKDSSRKRLMVPVSPDGRFTQKGITFYDTLKVSYDFPGNKKLSGARSLELTNNLLPAPGNRPGSPPGFAGPPDPGDSTTIADPPGSATATAPTDLTAATNRLYYFAGQEADREKKRQAMMLAAVTVNGRVRRPVDVLDDKYATGIFKRDAGFQFDVKDDPLAQHSTDIFFYLRQMVPGLEVRYENGFPILKWRQSTPTLFVDEVGMKADLVADIPITDIAYVKVFHPPFLLGGVLNPRAGAIAIYTKKGEDGKPLPTKGLNYKLVEGYDTERQFYSPDYSVDPATQTDFLPDVRPTLYWNPYVLTDATTHSARLEFYNNDISRKLRIVVEGMNAEGRLTRVEKIIPPTPTPPTLTPDCIGRGECKLTDGILHTRDAYACFGDTALRNYQFSFKAMAPLKATSATAADDAQPNGSEAPAGNGEVHICAGFRANNRDDRYILGLKGGSFNALYLERLGFMGTDDYLALRPLPFPIRPGEWYRFKVQVAGDRIRIFLGDEALPRIDVRDPNASLCPQGRVTLGGSYLGTDYDGLAISPLKENALDGPLKEEQSPLPDKEKGRQAERAAYQPLHLAALAGARTEISMDGNWLFCPGYELQNADDAILPSKEDRSWHVLHVPDFWNPRRVWLHGEKYKSESKGASDKYYQKEIDRCRDYSFDYTRTNIGWYRQWIELPAGVQGKHMELSFDAVSKVAEVWVNGSKAGSHIGMFGNFSLDVSTLLHPGRNLVTVKVLRNYVNDIKDADKIADVAVTVEVTQRMIKDLPHGFFVDDPAGIWQPVKLTVTDPLHISDVFVKPGLSGASFEVTVRNDGATDRTFALHTGIGTLYNGISVPAVTLKAGEERTLTYSVSGLHPSPWSPEDPHLYTFNFSIVTTPGRTSVASGRALVDSVSVLSGFRTFEAKDGFFYLNGRRYWLRGANQAAMPLGPNDARLAHRFCQLLHDAHINATRTHTVPFTETWMDAADRDGIGVSYEGTWPWLMIQSTMPDSSLVILWQQEWLHLLKKYRNHPSLLLWTVNNEMKFYDNDPDFERAKVKMRIISAVVKKMRAADPTRPMVFDSNYKRNKKKFGEAFLQEIDDGDVDDIHMYPNWYDNSIFDQFKGEFQTKFKNDGRPLISQEMSTGYSNNESGHPVRFYTFVHQTAQALVGKYAYDYSDPALFLNTHAFITKELAEAFRRTDDQASGILHFASITWFRYVYSADSIQPYPIYYAMKKALQPLLVSAELWGRHFYGGTHLPVRVCIVNDQDDTVLSTPSTLHWDLVTPAGSVIAAGTAPVDTLGYYGRRWLSPDIPIPQGSGRQDAKLVLHLMRGTTILSSNDYDIVLAPRSWALQGVPSIAVVDFGGRLSGVLDTLGVQHKEYTSLEAALATLTSGNAPGPLLLSGLNPGNTPMDDLAKIRTFVSGGGKVLLLNPGTMATFLYPQYIKGVLDTKGEIMNMDIPESPLFDGLEPLDLRYFNNHQRESPTVCAGSFQIIRQPNLEAPASFTRVHGYLQGDIGQREAALEKLRGFPIVRIDDKGSIILSQVLLDKATTDPVAGRLLTNMIRVLK